MREPKSVQSSISGREPIFKLHAIRLSTLNVLPVAYTD